MNPSDSIQTSPSWTEHKNFPYFLFHLLIYFFFGGGGGLKRVLVHVYVFDIQ